VPPVQLWVSIAEIGCFFALVALGFLIVREGAGFFNFALGTYAMFSGLSASYLVIEHGWPLAAAIAAGVVMSVGLSVATEVLVVRPIQGRTAGNELPSLVAVVASLYAIEQFAGSLFGRHLLPGRPWVEADPVTVGEAVIGAQTMVVVGATLLMFLLVAAWLRWTPDGRMLRAVGDNKHAARTLGLPVSRIRLMAFALAGAIAGVGGPLFSPKAGVGFQSGLSYTLTGFLALVIGGSGSVLAPLAGGLLLATAQILSSYYFGGASQDYAVLALALVFFSVRPDGVFARRVRT
jgi:branched-chain amino acid transport system permease protein